jgi:hypothetical protein
MGCLEAIMAEYPTCGSIYEELKTLHYELAPEIEGGIPKGLPQDLIMTQGIYS